MAATASHTADGVPITPGLAVWNNNLQRDRVVRLHHTEDERNHGVETGREVAWWVTERGLFDGSRMSSVHPTSGEVAEVEQVVSSVTEALARMDRLTAIVIEATVAEMRAAACAIARQTREQHPTAARVHLEASDQGDWLDVTGWDAGGAVEDLDLPEEVAFAAAHLYLPHIGSGEHVGAVPGLWCTDRRRGIFVLAVDQVLAECDQDPVLAEVLVTRDPDGPNDVDVAVLGRSVRPGQVRVFCVDAGAGWQWPDWVEHRDDCLAGASGGLQEPLRAALAAPPGGKYVEGRDGRDWLSGVAS
jgi:hypothetical protein